MLVCALFCAPDTGAQKAEARAEAEADVPLPEHAEDVVDYTMTARLDPAAHTVHGEGTIVWRNTSEKPVREVWLHLYLNAFKNESSTFMREPVGGARGTGGVTDWGYIDVRRFALATPSGETDLWPDADKTGGRPGDLDETDARVPLPDEVAPGASVTFKMTWDDKLPSIVERTGYLRSFHMVAQWFPKIARLEPDGTWAHFPFHHLAEFYSDFGTYDVTLEAPKAFVLGATGPVTEAHDDGELHVERHVQGDIHDFAWTAYDQYQERREKIDGVDVRILYPRGYGYPAERELATMRFALPYYGERYGRYPYTVLTLVHPPDGAEEAGGMEYPTLFSTGGSWYGPPGSLFLELVTIHEFGHQWFYGMLASDEEKWPFLDEGMNSYAEQDGLAAWRGQGTVIDALGLKISDTEADGAWPGDRVFDEPVAQPADAFPTGGHYGGLVYARTAALFATIDRVYGHDLGARAIGRYARRARFRHPVPEDLVTSYEEVFGPEVRAALEEGLFRRGWVDYKVLGVHSERDTAAAGVFDRDGKRETIKEGQDASGSYEGWVLVAREGTLRFPVDVELTFEDGTKQRVRWDAREAVARLPVSGKSALAYAVIDPDRAVLVDQDRLDDFARATSAPPGGSARVLDKATYALQLLMSTVLP